MPSLAQSGGAVAGLLERLHQAERRSNAHDGWIAHIWLWKKNPDGIFDNFHPEILLCECEVSPTTPLCTP